MTPPLRLAVVGLHNQGQEHLVAALACADVRVVALCDVSDDELDRAAMLVGGEVHRHHDLAATVADAEVDALVVALPHDLHVLAVEQCAAAGKHLLKEKPLGRTLSEAQSLATLARKAGIVLHTGVQRRHHATYERLRSLIVGERVVSADVRMQIVSTVRTADARPTWRADASRTGGGVLIDLGYHGVDLAHYLLGPLEPVSCVMSRDGVPCSPPTVESDAAVWAMAGSSWVRFAFGRGDRKLERVAVQTERSLFVADRARVWSVTSEGATETLFEAAGAWQATMRAQLESFVAAVRRHESAPNDLSDQVPTMRFLERCYAHARVEGLGASTGGGDAR